MEEEENYLDRPASEIAADILGSDVTPYVLGGGLTTATGSARGGAIKFDPKILGNMETQVMKNAPGGKFKLLADPKYIQYAKNTLPQAVSKNPMSVASASVIPLTAATIAYDVVKSDADRTERAMEEMYDQVDNFASDQQGLANRLRKLNIIEEQKAFDEGRAPFGGEEGITMGNLDEYFAANPDFSGIGDVQVPDSGYDQGGQFLPEKPGKYSFEDEIGAPGLDVYQGGVDYSSAFSQGQQQTPAPTESQFTSFLGNLANQGVSADDRAAIAGEMLRGIGSSERNARNAEIFQRARDEYAAKYGADSLKPKVGFGTEASASGSQGGLTMGDYRDILKAQGIGGSAQIALAKQMMQEAQLGKQKGQLQSDLLRAQIVKAQRPEKERAPTSIEMQAATIQQLVPIQQKLEAGIPISAEEEALYRSGSALINLQQRTGDFGADPAFKDIDAYQQQEVADATMQDPKILAFMKANKQFKTYEDAEKHLKEIGKI